MIKIEKKMKHEQYHYKMNRQERNLVDRTNKVVDTWNELIDINKSINKQMNLLLGKSKVDLFFEKKFDTPRKIKIAQNRAIHQVGPQHFTQNVKDTILYYLKKHDEIKIRN